MIGWDKSTIGGLSAAVALICALSLAGLSAAQAAPTKPAETDTRNGMPCGKLCKAYLAWSDRVMAALHPHSPSQPLKRIAAHPKRAERPRQRMAATPHSPLTSFAQLPQQSAPAPQPVETPHLETAASPGPIAQPALPAEENATASPAATDSTTNEAPELTPVSFTVPISATPASDTVSERPDLRLAISLVLVLALTLCTLLAIMFQKRSGGRTKAASTFR